MRRRTAYPGLRAMPNVLASCSATAFTFAFVLAGLAGLAGCSGSIAPTGDRTSDGGADDAGHDAAPDSPPPADAPSFDAPPIDEPDAPMVTGPCPASTPAIGSGCTDESLVCEYGASFYPGCDTIVQCSSGTWQTYSVSGACPGANSPDCPASMASAANQICDPSTAPSCFYATGGCYCGSSGDPIAPSPDGAIPDQVWQCDGVQPPCTYPRPRLGTTCAQDGLSCQYLQCDYAQQCQGGVWTGQPEGCAVAGQGASP